MFYQDLTILMKSSQLRILFDFKRTISFQFLSRHKYTTKQKIDFPIRSKVAVV